MVLVEVGVLEPPQREVELLDDRLDLADELVVAESPAGVDEVVCAGVKGSNLVADALAVTGSAL